MACVPARLHTGNVQQENTGQTSCAASVMRNTPKKYIKYQIMRQASARLGWQLG